MATIAYPHIELDTTGIALIADTQTKVLEVALDRLAHHWDADEIKRQHPHLSLAQIHAALAYYYDHEEEFNQQIRDRQDRANLIRTQVGESPVRAKLRARGLLP
jgi:uncharacterized protein (DUF433 family)